MKQETILKAHGALLQLSRYKLPVKKAFEVYKLQKALSDSVVFAAQQEKDYLIEFGGEIKEDGTILFPSPAQCAAFRDKRDELYKNEIDLAFEKVALCETDFGEQSISPEMIDALEGLVEFT